ncbi:MAG: DUF1028 domain-containing protein [Pseudomonadota bacterium]
MAHTNLVCGVGPITTYSIVARCDLTGELGAAVASAVPAVGSICLHMRPGVGAVSTQSWANPYLAIAILDAMAAGDDAHNALATALDGDGAASLRQVGCIGLKGPGCAYTGADCTGWCGAREGISFAAQGNMLTGPEVIDAMADAVVADGPLEERLMGALEAAQAAGGDKRGRQSASLAVIGAEDYRRVDLRVDEHADPITELRRVLTVANAQLAPFVAGMPKRGERGEGAPDAVVKMLLRAPPDRPGAGGSRTP